MYCECSGNIDLKIIDFGLSKATSLDKGKMLKTIVGTPYYLAPEVFEGQYGKECDCWSLGVIMYLLLSKQLPFAGDNLIEVHHKIKKGNFTFVSEFEEVSEHAKNLITGLLSVDKQKRISCAQALEHPWFTEILKDEHKTDINDALNALCGFKSESQLKKEALSVLVKMLD